MTARNGHAVVAEGLVKVYRSRGSRRGQTTEVRALDGLDLTADEGTVLGLLGPNGAGKTTAIRVLATLLRPDAGRATVAGFDVATQSHQIRSVIGLSGQFAAIDDVLTGRENLWMFGRLYQLPSSVARERADQLLEQFDLADAADRTAKTYSGGMRRRLDLASALIGRPRLLFMDEPTTGLDPRSRLGMWDVIRALVREGTTLLLTTQYLEEADALADTIAVVDHGRIIAQGTSDQLKSQVGGERIEVVVDDPRACCHSPSRCLPATPAAPRPSTRTRAGSPSPRKAARRRLMKVVRDFDEAGIGIDDIAMRRPTLDDVFLSLTGRAAEDATPEGPGRAPGAQPGRQRRRAPRATRIGGPDGRAHEAWSERTFDRRRLRSGHE